MHKVVVLGGKKAGKLNRAETLTHEVILSPLSQAQISDEFCQTISWM